MSQIVWNFFLKTLKKIFTFHRILCLFCCIFLSFLSFIFTKIKSSFSLLKIIYFYYNNWKLPIAWHSLPVLNYCFIIPTLYPTGLNSSPVVYRVRSLLHPINTLPSRSNSFCTIAPARSPSTDATQWGNTDFSSCSVRICFTTFRCRCEVLSPSSMRSSSVIHFGELREWQTDMPVAVQRTKPRLDQLKYCSPAIWAGMKLVSENNL